jgi:hypothetical protein
MSKRKRKAPSATTALSTAIVPATDTRGTSKKQASLRAIEKELPHIEDKLFALSKRALQEALRYGELLHQAKALLKHGEWLPWLREHVRFSQTAAWHYMKLWERRDDPKLVKLIAANNLADVTEAYAVLGLPWGKPPTRDELNPVRKKRDEHPTPVDEKISELLQLRTEVAIRNYIDFISAPDARPEDKLTWEILVREVEYRLKQSAEGGTR